MPAVTPARPSFNRHLLALDCSVCGRAHDLAVPRSVCESCGKPLVARYDLPAIAASVPREGLADFGSDLWRYRPVLPFEVGPGIVRLGEGGTPLLPLPRLGAAIGVAELWLKDEAPNPTQSFK